MTFIPNLNKTILFSGTNDLGSQNYFQLFDYSTSTWDHIAPDSYIPVPRWGHSLVHIESMGMLYLIGGGSWGVSEWDYRNDVHVYNFTSNQWTLLIYNGDSKISPRARFATQYDPIHNVILVHGGMNDSNIFDDTWTYDILENEWNELELENILFGSGHSIALMNNTFHLVEKYHYILDDLSLDTLYSRNDNRTDQISDYDREACLQTNFFIELFGLTGFPPLYLVAIIGTPIILTLWIWIVRRSKAKERQ